eukprot:gnl/MRDRNA2_/MRDRNA2_120122_c0_seq1.p1 gnl/MRDRNA2_/MRDRNA2_120122_c0~~gnl/MRDRNA2_/MRDRNA2_120122_c0_seq1.p1  ORF type:complete len:353 (+),score=62.20 gnl/MRDRNA2_/MRDRNA2_120122_c0_seq1:62-1120(+)
MRPVLHHPTIVALSFFWVHPCILAGPAWRMSNGVEIDGAWRVRSIQFFSDIACTTPLMSLPNATGTAFASAAAEMTDADHAFNVRSHRGWESEDICEPGQCHLGFEFFEDTAAVECVILHQGEDLHAEALSLERRNDQGAWVEVVSWKPLGGGRMKLSTGCPEKPDVANAQVLDCRKEDKRTQECAIQCSAGFGAIEPRLRCVHGAWFQPECVPVGSMARIVAQAPQLIKPYWVVLDATLFANTNCSDPVKMDGMPFSSGEFVIKYANYAPKNVWDGDPQTSWASKTPCEPGQCFIGFRFKAAPKIGCASVKHPEGDAYRASVISLETIGPSGWEAITDATVEIDPSNREEL